VVAAERRDPSSPVRLDTHPRAPLLDPIPSPASGVAVVAAGLVVAPSRETSGSHSSRAGSTSSSRRAASSTPAAARDRARRALDAVRDGLVRAHPLVDPLADPAQDGHVVVRRQAEQQDEQERGSQAVIPPIDSQAVRCLPISSAIWLIFRRETRALSWYPAARRSTCSAFVSRWAFVEARGDEGAQLSLELPRHHALWATRGLGGLAGGLASVGGRHRVQIRRRVRRTVLRCSTHRRSHTPRLQNPLYSSPEWS
jgi:hypothetical protein